MLKLYCDGSAIPSPPNPKAKGYFAFIANSGGFTKFRTAGYLGKSSWMWSKVAETITALKALEYIVRQEEQDRATLISDSYQALQFIRSGEWTTYSQDIPTMCEKYLQSYRNKVLKEKECKVNLREAHRSEVRIPHYLCKLTHRGVTKGGISLDNANMHVNHFEREALVP